MWRVKRWWLERQLYPRELRRIVRREYGQYDWYMDWLQMNLDNRKDA